MKNAPPSLFSRLYQFWSPHVEAEELHYYQHLAQKAKGSILELAPGGGRILLPLAKQGFDMEGVEPSSEMVQLIRARATRLGVDPKIYEQRIESVEIKGKSYQLIYCTMGTFQLITNLLDTKIALEKYRVLLGEKGELSLALFLPWAEVPIFGDGAWRIVQDQTDRKVKRRYILREQTYHDPVEQVIQCNTRFEVWDGKDLLEMMPRTLEMRWYSKGEIILLLEEAGFKTIEVARTYRQETSIKDSLMLIRAVKK